MGFCRRVRRDFQVYVYRIQNVVIWDDLLLRQKSVMHVIHALIFYHLSVGPFIRYRMQIIK